MLEFSHYQWISFDCYGTLIDWESGILGYLRPLLRRKRRALSDAEILKLYSELEPREQSGEYRTYREVLASVVKEFARELGFHASQSEAAGLAESIRDWQPFPETATALSRLHSRYQLAVLSNIDDHLFAWSAEKLKIRFDAVVTAQQVGSYKPSRRNFEALVGRLGISRDRLLHVAESLFHDVAPAQALGIRTVWVNRRQGKAAAASQLAAVRADVEVRSLAELAELAVG